MVVPSGALQGPRNGIFLIGGVSPRGPHRDKYQGHFCLGALLCLIEERAINNYNNDHINTNTNANANTNTTLYIYIYRERER